MDAESAQLKRMAQEQAKQAALEKEKATKAAKERNAQMKDRIRKSVKRRNQKPFYKRYEDEIGYVIVGLIVAGVVYMNFSGDRRRLSEIMVLDESHIQMHNESGRDYTLKENDFFEGLTLEDAQKMFHNKFTDKQNTPKCEESEEEVRIPESYNFYQSYPDCSYRETQRKASTGYVEAPLSVFRSRYCYNKLGEDFEPSADYPLNCNLEMNKGDRGGYLMRTLDFMDENGVVDAQCWERLNVNENDCPSEEELNDCVKRKQGSYCMLEGLDVIKRDIVANGPVISMLQPLRNLLSYESGVLDVNEYEPKLDGFQTVKLVGWDMDEEGTHWWLVDPMWGESFGEEGLVRIKIESEDSFLDKFAIAIHPAAS